MRKILIVVGHQSYDKGARSMDGQLSEYDFNLPLAAKVVEAIQHLGHSAVEMDTYQSYRSTGKSNVRRWDGASDLLVELHLNAAPAEVKGRATGSTALFCSISSRGATAARILAEEFHNELGLRLRHMQGILPRSRYDRGGYLLWGVRQLALIGEPGFIDNANDLAVLQEKDLAMAYARACKRIVEACYG